MDSDATFKPVLHLVVAPISSELLAPSVRTQLGMKNIKGKIYWLIFGSGLTYFLNT